MDVKKSTILKSIRDHLFDFLMLFLAVTLGFIADNYRDDYSDQQEAKELAGDLLSDIASDTITIHKLIHQNETSLHKLDSLGYFIADHQTSFNDSLIYYYSSWVFTGINLWFERNDNTYELMLNSGSLSYLKKNSAGAVTNYEHHYQKTLELIEIQRTALNNKIYPFQQQLFHVENFNSILNGGGFVIKPELHSWNKETRLLYHNYVTEVRIRAENLTAQYQHLLEKARETMDILRKDYNL